MRQDALLWSINDRLGGGAGVELPRLSDDWVDDLVLAAVAQNDELEEMKAELENREKRRVNGDND
jgi:hypothetical protein